MKRKTMALLLGTHLLVAAAGFAAGVYTLPILIAPPAPDTEQVAASQQQARFHGTFRRDLKDSDRLHWGEGKVSIGPDAVSLM
ncbi:MAG: DM13 domain-containing protein, partial [Aeromonas sp.]